MTPRKNSKGLILIEAFKLFAYNNYDQVTFTKLEEATKLTRGTIMYHFTSKELIYKAVIHEFVLKRSTIESLLPVDSFRKNIHNIIKFYSEEKKHFKHLGIKNINRAFCNIEFIALSNLESAEEVGQNWYNSEKKIWVELLSRAIETNEIRDDINIDSTAEIFLNQYIAISYRGVSRKNGFDEKLLENTLIGIYNLIKK